MTVSERDSEAVSRAIRILSEAGYSVEQVNTAREADHGVVFELKVEARTRTHSFGPQSEAVRQAAIEADEFGMDGEPVQDGESA